MRFYSFSYVFSSFPSEAVRYASSSASSSVAPSMDYGSVDHLFDKDRIQKTAENPGNRRDFTYFMLGNGRMIYATTARLALIKVVATMSASADVLALASAEFDISNIAEGTTMTVKWRGKPVFIRHRTGEEISKEESVNLHELKDPQNDKDRVQTPEW
jgi:ubiquinol-cytochrome c reductase iron-sulfur subunit